MTQPAPTPNAVDAQGNPTTVDYAQLGQAWKQGQAQPLVGQTYYLQHPNGTIEHTADPAVMHAALERGASFMDPTQAQGVVHNEELEHRSGGALGAFAGGALEQGTLGLSDVFGAANSDDWKELREHQREAHPVASFLGEGTGAAGLAALTGGGSALEEGAGALLKGVGESTMDRIGARTLMGAAKAGVEGAQFGTSQAISDSAFANKPLTANQIISTIGMNALWGAGAGGALGLLSGAAGEMGGKLFNRSAASPSDVEAVAGRALGEEPAPGLGDAIKRGYAKLAGVASGNDPKEILSVLENRADLADIDEIRNAAAKQIRASGDEVAKYGDQVRDIWNRGQKIDFIRQAVKGVDPAEAARVSRNMVDETISKLEEMTADPDAYGGAGPLKNAIKVAKKASQRLDDALGFSEREARVPLKDIEPQEPWSDEKMAALREQPEHEPIHLYESENGKYKINDGIHRYNVAAERGATDIAAKVSTEAHDVAEMYAAVDDLKKAVGKYTQGARNARGGATDELVSMQNQARVDAYKKLYEHLRTGLEDEKTWGEMGTKQKEINQIYSHQIDASQRYNKALTTEIGRDPADPWEKLTGVDPAKAQAYVNNLTNPSKDLTHQAVNDYVDHTQALTAKMLEHFDLSDADRAAVEKVASAAGDMRETLNDTTRRLQVVNQAAKLRETTSGHAVGFGMLAATMGHPHAALPAMALGRLSHIFTHPAETIHKLAVVEKMVRESDGRIARAIRGFAQGMGRRSESVDVESFGRKAAKVAEMVANPAGLAAKVASRVATMRSHAPGLADAMTQTSVAAANYLTSKLPPRLPPDPLDPKAKPLAPSQEQKEAFLRAYKAVDDPLSVVDDLRDGKLHPDSIDALKTVYPPLYAQVQSAAVKAAADGKFQDLTPQKRAALGIMLNIPIPELTPEYIMARQQAYVVGLSVGPAASPGMDGKPQSGPGPKPTGGNRRSRPMEMASAKPTLAVDRMESASAQE